MSDKSGEVPPYAIPEVGEEIRVFDGTYWGHMVPAVYAGFERVADDFFMHQVRTDGGVESLASYAVFRLHGDQWESLTPKPRTMARLTSLI